MRLTMAVLAASLLLASPVLAAEHCGRLGVLNQFTDEQQWMIFGDMEQATAGGGHTAMREYRQTQRQKIRDMSAAERQAYQEDLSKRWNALSSEQQLHIRQRAEKWREEHPLGNSNCEK